MSLDFFRPFQQPTNSQTLFGNKGSEPEKHSKANEFEQIAKALETQREKGPADRQQRDWRAQGRKGTATTAHQQQQPQPYISGGGGAKRKFTEFQKDMQQQQCWPTFEDAANAEPKAKRRYEERMSTKLGGMNLRDEAEAMAEEENVLMRGAQGQHQGPRIEEITDWDEELLDEDDTDQLIRQAASAPIIEEKGDSSEEEEGGNQQRIVIDPALRDLLRASNQQQSNGGCEHFLPIGRPIRTGKELIPYVPSASSSSSSSPSLPQIINGERLRVEEIEDDEVLLDTADSPQVQSSDNDDSWPPTPLPADATVSEDEENSRNPIPDGDEEETAMELD